MTSKRQIPPKKAVGVPSKKARDTSRNDTPAPEAKPDLEAWLTRHEASDLLRCSTQTLKNYTERNMLHPREAFRKDRGGFERLMLVYNPKELAALPQRNAGGQPRIAVREPGEQAARAFELFREGLQLDEIVIQLRETPDRIEQLHERWLDQSQARYVITPEAKKAFEDLVGGFSTVAELHDLVARRIKALST